MQCPYCFSTIDLDGAYGCTHKGCMSPKPGPEPSDSPVTTVDIKATFDGKVWSVYCPQWRCELHSKDLSKCVAALLKEIEEHNAQVV